MDPTLQQNTTTTLMMANMRTDISSLDPASPHPSIRPTVHPSTHALRIPTTKLSANPFPGSTVGLTQRHPLPEATHLPASRPYTALPLLSLLSSLLPHPPSNHPSPVHPNLSYPQYQPPTTLTTSSPFSRSVSHPSIHSPITHNTNRPGQRAS